MPQIQPLLDAETIAARVREMGQEISRDYAGEEVVLVIVLKGSFVFGADLARAIDLPVTMDFLGLRSYGDGVQSSGVVEITTDLSKPVAGKHLIVIEDIVDTGLTMDYLFKNLATRGPKSVKLASLLHKPARTKVHVDIDYLGFTIEDVFVVGYGLDFAQKYRNVPFLGVLESDGVLE
ncbi:MAG: hypoxanthine phosphoribosyltransferase [Myxococcales bacterium]|nr:hypoxanthine phosphoribosyltransferase [Myxococcales bacterium]